MGRPKLDRKQIQSRVDSEVYEWLAKDGNVSEKVERIIVREYNIMGKVIKREQLKKMKL